MIIENTTLSNSEKMIFAKKVLEILQEDERDESSDLC